MTGRIGLARPHRRSEASELEISDVVVCASPQTRRSVWRQVSSMDRDLGINGFWPLALASGCSRNSTSSMNQSVAVGGRVGAAAEQLGVRAFGAPLAVAWGLLRSGA
ncbi:MAG: hypothetical protein ABI427_17650 [Solirubrobacteraceae bacterium]